MTIHRSTLRPGDLVYVTMTDHGGKPQPIASARLVGYGRYHGINDRPYLSVVVEYTATSGKPHGADHRKRGEQEVVTATKVVPRDLHGDTKVTFVDDNGDTHGMTRGSLLFRSHD